MFDFKLKGVIPPMITPFDEYGKLDERALAALVEYLSERVDGLFICGSYGCGPLMSVGERKKVAEIVKKNVSNGTAVVVHTGTTNDKDTIELCLHAQEIGCDAVSAVGPYYYEYKDMDLFEYYAGILHEVREIPFYIYHNPKFQGYPTNLDVIKRLKDIGLNGIKDATFDIMAYAVYARELMDENFDVALGTEAMWVSAHALGCKAFIPGVGNVFPELCTDMWKNSMRGDKDKALELQFLINRLRDVMYLTRSTQLAIYAIAELKGIIKSYPRSPFIAATGQEKEAIRKGLDELGVL
jgi:dihydrodipicolinate synthase/N-acetylneuraminate lyase